MNDIMFFDANCQIGLPMLGNDRSIDSVAALLSEMDRTGVTKALVAHANTDAAGALYGNDDLSRLMAEDKEQRLTAVWCVLPEQCRELPPPAKLFAKMEAANARALTLHPVAHRWQACRLTIGRLIDAASERKVPVVLRVGALEGGWRGVYDFMREFPAATVIVSKLGLWGADRNVRPLLENFPGCHLELSEYWVPEGIADLACHYGVDRLLYGSGYPNFGHGSTMLSIRHSRLPAEQVRLIAGQNLERLLKQAALQ